jgi:hypothetical protein
MGTLFTSRLTNRRSLIGILDFEIWYPIRLTAELPPNNVFITVSSASLCETLRNFWLVLGRFRDFVSARATMIRNLGLPLVHF